MEYNRMERMVHEYLNSMVGGSPVLRKEKVVGIHRSNVFPSENFYVNGIWVCSIGTIEFDNFNLSIEPKLRDSIEKLFDLDKDYSYLYFREWINKLDGK